MSIPQSTDRLSYLLRVGVRPHMGVGGTLHQTLPSLDLRLGHHGGSAMTSSPGVETGYPSRRGAVGPSRCSCLWTSGSDRVSTSSYRSRLTYFVGGRREDTLSCATAGREPPGSTRRGPQGRWPGPDQVVGGNRGESGPAWSNSSSCGRNRRTSSLCLNHHSSGSEKSTAEPHGPPPPRTPGRRR